MNQYGWIITEDLFFDGAPGDRSEKYAIGPRGCSPTIKTALEAGEGKEFILTDDDRVHYFKGRYIGPNDETLFAPLDDFGAAHSGCTAILYKSDHNEWEVL